MSKNTSVIKFFSPKRWIRKFVESFYINLASKDTAFAKLVLDSSTSVKLFDESGIIANLFKLGDCEVRDIMTHRKEIIAVDIIASNTDIIRFFSETKCIRIPVYSMSIDNIVGFINIKDVFATIGSSDFCVQKVMREIIFVPPLMKTMNLLIKMKATSVKVAIVVDEYGITEGLVTLSNIVDKIVGEIQDNVNEKTLPSIINKSNNIYEVYGRTLLKDIEEVSGVSLFDTDDSLTSGFSTIGGLVLSILGRVPVENEIIKHESGVVFTIIRSDERCIHKLLVDVSFKDDE